jgi:Flp pilus assembly pilin Flp
MKYFLPKRNLIKDTKGAPLVEYTVLTGLIGVVCIGVVLQLGQQVEGTFDEVSTTLEDKINIALENETSTPSTGSGTATTPPATGGSGSGLPNTGDCTLVLGNTSAVDYAEPPCFISNVQPGESFQFYSNLVPFYAVGDPYDPNGPSPSAAIDALDTGSTTIISNGSNNYMNYTGGAGVDTIRVVGWTPDDVWIVPNGAAHTVQFGDVNNYTDNYNVLEVQFVEQITFDDGTVIQSTDFNDPTYTDQPPLNGGSGSGGPGGGGPVDSGSSEWYESSSTTITNMFTNEVWEAAISPVTGYYPILPNGLAWKEYVHSSVVFETEWCIGRANTSQADFDMRYFEDSANVAAICMDEYSDIDPNNEFIIRNNG